jgi:formate/nitrite transporter FocA (FNT family)
MAGRHGAPPRCRVTPGVRAAVFYAAVMLVIMAGLSTFTPSASLAARALYAQALLAGTLALLAWILLCLGPGGPGSFPQR